MIKKNKQSAGFLRQVTPTLDTVFVLIHSHRLGIRDDEKMIGVYRTEANAKDAIIRLQDQPGFADCKEGFTIDEYELNKDHWTEGY